MATGPRRTQVERDLIEGLREAVHAATTGDYSRLTVREVEVADPGVYGSREIKALRARLGVTQELFARLMGVSKDLVRHWEHGVRKPAPLACRLMDRIGHDPAGYLSSLVRRRIIRPARIQRAG